MTFVLDHVVPWGRSFEEYVQFFDLGTQDLAKRIIGCADGPAAFNSVLTGRGGSIISCDPLYRLSGNEIRARIAECYPEIYRQVVQNKDLFNWESISSPRELGILRHSAMKLFMADYEKGRREGRYCTAALPYLPFADNSFDLALCSHFLFYYSGSFSESFHREAIAEMLRVAPEARIFPLVNLNGRVSSYRDTLGASFQKDGFEVEIRTVPYEFIRGGNQAMIISRKL